MDCHIYEAKIIHKPTGQANVCYIPAWTAADALTQIEVGPALILHPRNEWVIELRPHEDDRAILCPHCNQKIGIARV